MHSSKTCWSESINTLVAFVTLLSADYVSENCRIIKEVVVAGCCCTCSNQVPNLRSPVPGPAPMSSQLRPTGPLKSDKKTFKYLLQQKNSRPYSLKICQCHCCQKKSNVDNQEPLTKRNIFEHGHRQILVEISVRPDLR